MSRPRQQPLPVQSLYSQTLGRRPLRGTAQEDCPGCRVSCCLAPACATRQQVFARVKMLPLRVPFAHRNLHCAGGHPSARRPRVLVRADPSNTTATQASAPAAPAQPASEDERFHEAYSKAWTMSQLYVKNRPAPVPLSDYEARRRKRDAEDILAAARRKGKNEAQMKENLAKLESILPNLVDLNKMRATDWLVLVEDVNAVANKLITLKAYYPEADVFAIAASRPKTLMQSDDSIRANAEQVRKLLQRVKNIDAIVEAVPELTDATTLVRSLGWLKSSFPEHDAVELLEENPKLLLNQGESNMEDFAEYGEMTTKD